MLLLEREEKDEVDRDVISHRLEEQVVCPVTINRTPSLYRLSCVLLIA